MKQLFGDSSAAGRMLYSGSLLLQSRALGEDLWGLLGAARCGSAVGKAVQVQGGVGEMQASKTVLLPGAETDSTGAPVMLWHFSSCFTSQQPCSAPAERPTWRVSPNSSVSQSLPSTPCGPCYREKVKGTSQSPCCWK